MRLVLNFGPILVVVVGFAPHFNYGTPV